VKAGNIASGVLYRSSTPFTNEINRANYVSDYLESQKITTVLNLADTKEKIQSYDMPPYSRTLWEGDNVILCPLKTDPTADDYNKKLIAALKELPSRPAPYVVHCMEGKDRTGYVCALLEGLCGATYEEIVTDFKDEAQLPNVDYAKAFSNYLLSHGMSSEQVDALIKVLTVTATGNH
jgi:protein tyrosine/serine phosphatase